jgi:HAD superfamily hydrolase (TIGR01490 family)
MEPVDPTLLVDTDENAGGQVRIHARVAEHAVHPTYGRAAAFFDLDRTLISGSSVFTFGIAAWRAGMVPTARIARDAAGALSFLVAGASDDTTTKVRQRILGAVVGQRQDDLIALNEEIVPKLLAKIRPEARRLLDLHRRANRATYIVSASPRELVEPLAQALGMTGGIGTVATVVDGIYTGELSGPFCYAEGKVEAIEELARWEGFDLGECYAYSDSASDLPMLEAVGHPVAVNPDGKLERRAQDHGWPIVVFSRHTKAVIRRTTAGLGAATLAASGFVAGFQAARHRQPG